MVSYLALVVFGVTFYPISIDYMKDRTVFNNNGDQLHVCEMYFIRGDRYKEIERSCQEVKNEIVRLTMEYRNGDQKHVAYGYEGEKG